MRKTLILAAALLLAACGGDTTGPADADLFAFSAGEFGSVMYGMQGAHPGRGLPELGRLRLLPDSIALTAQQEAEINALLEAFQAANQADLEALAAIMDDAREARQAGKPRAEIAAILAPAREIHLRLAAAHVKLHADINAVLTPAQRAWLARTPGRCSPTSATPLTDAQKAQIRALYDAFQAANRTDLDAVKAALEQARAARQSGATAEQVRAILDGAKDAMLRLQAAGDKLREDVAAVLTPEQRASGCFRPAGQMGMGMRGPMHR